LLQDVIKIATAFFFFSMSRRSSRKTFDSGRRRECDKQGRERKNELEKERFTASSALAADLEGKLNISLHDGNSMCMKS
jgi:hypothetical protein